MGCPAKGTLREILRGHQWAGGGSGHVGTVAFAGSTADGAPVGTDMPEVQHAMRSLGYRRAAGFQGHGRLLGNPGQAALLLSLGDHSEALRRGRVHVRMGRRIRKAVPCLRVQPRCAGRRTHPDMHRLLGSGQVVSHRGRRPQGGAGGRRQSHRP